MVRNDERRARIVAAAIEVLATDGFGGLSFRTVDARAGLPPGTTTNYFRSRAALVARVAERIGERLGPSAELLERLKGRTPDRALFATYLRDLVGRLLADRAATAALFELRLAAGRGDRVASPVLDWQARAFEADLAFTARAELPADRVQIALLHHAIEGFVLDQLTQPIAPELGADEVVDRFVTALLGAPVD